MLDKLSWLDKITEYEGKDEEGKRPNANFEQSIGDKIEELDLAID